MTLTTYRCGVMTLSQTGQILMLMVGAGYLGTSTYGIKIGGQASEGLARYGVPSRRVELPPGQSWACMMRTASRSSSATGRWSPSWCFS